MLVVVAPDPLVDAPLALDVAVHDALLDSPTADVVVDGGVAPLANRMLLFPVMFFVVANVVTIILYTCIRKCC